MVDYFGEGHHRLGDFADGMGGYKSGKNKMIKGMHTYPSHTTSTQKTEMDLGSGSKALAVQSIIHMTLAHKTLLFCGKPPGMPLDLELVRNVSHHGDHS